MADVGNSLRVFAEAWQDHRRHQARMLRIDTFGLDVLEHLVEAGSSSPGELAAAFGVTSATMATALRRLEGAGHIRREHLLEDRRRVRVSVSLTPVSGSRLAAASLRASMGKALETLSDQDADLLADALISVADSLERSPRPPGTRYRARAC